MVLVMMCRIDVAEAFREIPVDSAGALVLEDPINWHVVVDFDISFSSVTAQVIEGVPVVLRHERTNMTNPSAVETHR